MIYALINSVRELKLRVEQLERPLRTTRSSKR